MASYDAQTRPLYPGGWPSTTQAALYWNRKRRRRFSSIQETLFKTISGLEAAFLFCGTRQCRASGIVLTPTGAALDDQPVLGLKPNGLTSSTMRFALNDGTNFKFPNFQIGRYVGESFGIHALLRSTDPNNVSVNVCGRRDSTSPFPGWELHFGSINGRIQARIDNGDAMVDTVLSGFNYNDGQYHFVSLIANVAAGTWRLHSELESGSSVVLPPVDQSESVPLSVGKNRLNSAGADVPLLAITLGPQLHSIDARAVSEALWSALVVSDDMVVDSNLAIVTDSEGAVVYASS